MKDTIAIGSVAGLIGGAIGILFSHSMFIIGVTPLSSLHFAATLVVTDIMELTVGGIVWSVITHHAVAAGFGIFMTLVLRYFGQDYWALKGIAFGVGVCLILHAYLLPLGRPDLNLRPNAAAFGTIAITHALIGLIATYIIIRLKKMQLT